MEIPMDWITQNAGVTGVVIVVALWFVRPLVERIIRFEIRSGQLKIDFSEENQRNNGHIDSASKLAYGKGQQHSVEESDDHKDTDAA